VKKVIELLKNDLGFSYRNSDTHYIEEAIAELQNPTPITPEQYREIEGREYPWNGLIYYRDNDTESFQYDTYAGAVDDERYQIVCAYNLTEPPPAGWRPG
jgi:hypothetical protein